MPKSYPPPWPCMGIQHARNASPSFHSWGKNLLPCGRSRGASASRGAAAALFPGFWLDGKRQCGNHIFWKFWRKRRCAALRALWAATQACGKKKTRPVPRAVSKGSRRGFAKPCPVWPAGGIDQADAPPAPLPAPKACNAVAIGIKAGKWLKNATQEGHRLSRSSR